MKNSIEGLEDKVKESFRKWNEKNRYGRQEREVKKSENSVLAQYSTSELQNRKKSRENFIKEVTQEIF